MCLNWVMEKSAARDACFPSWGGDTKIPRQYRTRVAFNVTLESSKPVLIFVFIYLSFYSNPTVRSLDHADIISSVTWRMNTSKVFTNSHVKSSSFDWALVPPSGWPQSVRGDHWPMAQVLLSVCCCSSVTIWAFWVGEQRQQTTAGHWQANSTNSCS